MSEMQGENRSYQGYRIGKYGPHQMREMPHLRILGPSQLVIGGYQQLLFSQKYLDGRIHAWGRPRGGHGRWRSGH